MSFVLKHLLLLAMLPLLLISFSQAFSQSTNNPPTLSVSLSSDTYNEGDTIVISGMVTTIIGETPITLELFTEGNLVDIAQITVAQDGSYSHTILAEGPLWKKVGTYTVRVSYGEGNIAESEFSYTPKLENDPLCSPGFSFDEETSLCLIDVEEPLLLKSRQLRDINHQIISFENKINRIQNNIDSQQIRLDEVILNNATKRIEKFTTNIESLTALLDIYELLLFVAQNQVIIHK